MPILKPQAKVPEIQVNTLDGALWTLSGQRPKNFTMIVFYRGHHCPVCRTYIHDLDSRLHLFRLLGVGVIAVSGDTRELAERSREEWKLRELTIGWGFPIEEARGLGLYVSKRIKEGEPDEFIEPGLFLIRPDMTLYAASVQSMPFARPNFDEIVNALRYIIEKKHPARGES